MVIDPTCGPYYDEENSVLEDRSGVSFHYWWNHPYPVNDVWCYYNDIYYTTENAEVAGWEDSYNAEANFLSGFTGLLSEGSFNGTLVYVALAIAVIIAVVSLFSVRKNKSGK